MEPTVFSETPAEDLVCFVCKKALSMEAEDENVGLCSPIDSFRGFACCSEHTTDAKMEARKWLRSKGFVSPFLLKSDILKEALESPVTVTRESGESEDGWNLTIIRTNEGVMTYKNFPTRQEDGTWTMCMRKGSCGVRNVVPENMTSLIDALNEQWTMAAEPQCIAPLEVS